MDEHDPFFDPIAEIEDSDSKNAPLSFIFGVLLVSFFIVTGFTFLIRLFF